MSTPSTTRRAGQPDASPVRGLHALTPERLSFDRDVAIRSFLLERPSGNLLLYGAPRLPADEAAIEAAGGFVRHYLGHAHEAGFGPPDPVHVHVHERDAVAASRPVAGTFAERQLLDGDFELLPIPGHTPGSAAYLWSAGQRRILFAADTMYLRDGEWRGAVLDSSDRAVYLESLARLRELEFDVLVPWAASAGGAWYAETDADDRRRRIDAIAERIRSGGST